MDSRKEITVDFLFIGSSFVRGGLLSLKAAFKAAFFVARGCRVLMRNDDCGALRRSGFGLVESVKALYAKGH